MLIDQVPWVLCEWHTDFICSGLDGSVPHALVSVKHRGADQGPWALADLPDRGGLKTLYSRWTKGNKDNSCRLMTNAAFKPGSEQAEALRKLLDRQPRTNEEQANILLYAEKLHKGIGADSIEAAGEFLNSLTLVKTIGDEFTIIASMIENVARPTLRTLGIDEIYARQVCKVATSLVEEAVKGLDSDKPTLPWLTGDNKLDDLVDRRKITRERLISRLIESGIPLTFDLVDHGGPNTAMTRKLRAGGLGPTVIRSAPRLRSRWFEIEVGYRADLPTPFGDEVQRIRAEVANRAGIAESSTRTEDGKYGQKMHHVLNNLLTLEKIAPRIPVREPEIMGCAYQLTDECIVWWSDRFDTATEDPSNSPGA